MTYTLSTVKDKIKTDQRWLQRAIVVLYQHQTHDEQVQRETKYRNDVGFNSADAKKLSYYAKWISLGKNLSGHHLQTAFKLVPKYSKQILNLINENKDE